MVCHCEILCIILKLHFSRFLKHVCLITLKIRRLLVQLLCVFGPHFWITFLRYVCITSLNNVTATFRFCLLLRCNFVTYFILFNNFTYLFKWFRFLMKSELRSLHQKYERRGEFNQNGKISSSDGERR